MRNFVQPGGTLTVPARTGGVASGDGALLGTLFGVALHDPVEAADLELLTEDAVELPKAAPLAIGLDDRLFWDATNRRLNKTPQPPRSASASPLLSPTAPPCSPRRSTCCLPIPTRPGRTLPAGR